MKTSSSIIAMAHNGSLTRGFFCEIKEEENGESVLSFIMANCAGRDLETIILGCVQLGVKLGMI